MNIRQKLEHVLENLNDEQLSTLLNFAVFLKSKEKGTIPIVESQAYEQWLSTENYIYDELFAERYSTSGSYEVHLQS